ncbi:MAG: hypothetical protein NZT92_22760 [Abditibacteriales bacterium]|nr:hypothetical protein [Abditibacteriales bacterium]MDW8367460.1 hypothetical protein [Abditibacteriales bacterium]
MKTLGNSNMNKLRFDGNKWFCPFCGYDSFTQSVIAENHMVLWTEGKVLVESDDFEGSWQVVDNGGGIDYAALSDYQEDDCLLDCGLCR